jgi:PilZ domain
MQPRSSPSRRFTTRVQTPGDVWVCWKCQGGRDDVSLVRNMSMGGLFIETPHARPSGTLTRLDFLVAEGQTRADAIVRHARAGAGLGLRFTALTEQDRPKLAALVTRLRRAQHVLGSA